VPPADLLQGTHTRQTPYLYSPAQILALMASARRLTPALRAASFETLIGLMAATGIRTGEAFALDRSDVDLGGAVLIVRCSKFGKSRQVPLHATTAAALRSYAGHRDRACPRPSTPSFLVSHAGTRLERRAVGATFRRLLVNAGVVTPPARRRPRLYDLRHSFAVTTLLSWHAAGADVQQRLPTLSTYMGHLNPKETYWYLEAAPELMAVVAARLEHYLADLP
jgi:integrase